MTYPTTRLTRPFRRAIMIFLIALFVILAPLIIFYTAGYRYDFTSREIKQTGVISIDVKPRNALIYLNNVQIKKNIPIRLSNRAPGTYHLKIESAGYQTWEKDITVESKQTTYIRNITLFRQSLPTELALGTEETANNVFLSTDGKYALILKNKNNIYELSLLNTRDRSLTPINRAYGKEAPTVAWSPYYPVALIQTKTGTLQLLDAESPEINGPILSIKNVQTLKYQWNELSYNPSIFVQNNSVITELSLSNRRDLPSAIAQPIWYFSDSKLWQYDPETRSVKTSDGDKEKIFSIDGDLKRIIHLNNERLIAQTTNSIIVVPVGSGENRTQKNLNVENIRYSPGTQEWLAWSPWELWTIYQDGDTELLNRTSAPINFVAPLDEFGLLLMSTRDSIKGFNPGYYVTHDLFSNGRIESVSADMDNREIFFWGETDGKKGLFGLAY
jgi:hypothetical protein